MAYSCVYPSGYTLDAGELAKYATGKRFTSMATWEAQNLNLVTATDNEICEVLAGDETYYWSTADSRFDINGWTTNATYGITITVLAGARHSGTYDTDKYRIEYANYDTSVTTRVSNITFDGFQVNKTHASDTGMMCNHVTGDYITWKNSIFVRPSAAAAGACFFYSYGRSDFIAQNCIFYGSKFTYIWYDNYNDNPDIYFLNCTIVGCTQSGLRRSNSSGALNVLNCYSGDSVAADDYVGCTLTTSASSDTSGSTGLQSIAVNTTNFTNVSSGTEDFSLPSGSGLIDEGTDLESTYSFNDDIVGTERGATWDVGAFEYAGGGGLSIPIASYHYRNHM